MSGFDHAYQLIAISFPETWPMYVCAGFAHVALPDAHPILRNRSQPFFFVPCLTGLFMYRRTVKALSLHRPAYLMPLHDCRCITLWSSCFPDSNGGALSLCGCLFGCCLKVVKSTTLSGKHSFEDRFCSGLTPCTWLSRTNPSPRETFDSMSPR